MAAVYARIIARWIASALVTYGWFMPEYAADLDTDLALVLGAVLGAVVEGVYALAKRKGWAT